LTLTVAGVFKELVTLLLAASTVKGNELTGINLLGLFVSLLGIGGYNYIKYREASQGGAYTRVKQNEDDKDEMQMQPIGRLSGSAPSSPTHAVTRARVNVNPDGMHENLLETEM
jgi:hypothetical protein